LTREVEDLVTKFFDFFWQNYTESIGGSVWSSSSKCRVGSSMRCCGGWSDGCVDSHILPQLVAPFKS